MEKSTKKLLELSKDAAQSALSKLVELGENNVKSYSFSSEIPREIKATADVIIEDLILSCLLPTGIDIFSEECGLLKGNKNSTLKFIIDPIDGSVNFVRGILNCSISIALFDGDEAIFGVLASYPDGSITWGGKGVGVFCNNAKLVVSNIDNPEKGVLCTGFPSRFNFDTESILLQIDIMSQFGKTRMLGSASQSLLQVASGGVECYAERNIMLWDVAAGIAIVEGAGGRVRRIPRTSGGELDIIADNGRLNLNIISW